MIDGRVWCRILTGTVIATLLNLSPSAGAAEAPVAALIVMLRDTAPGTVQPMSATRLHTLSARTGVTLTPRRVLATGAQLLELPRPLSETDAAALAAALQADPAVEYAEPDRRLHPVLVPDDTRYAEQWYLFEDAGGLRVPQAWDATTGDAGVIVAVLDSGYRPHAEFAARILPGYDFISDTFTANDGDGREASALDPGDWVTSGEAAAHPELDCFVDDSSWHGTYITGLMAAAGDNAAGIAGIAWQTRLLPVRVLGKCGGDTSDIVDAMYWAAGLHVSGVPDNSTPAQIINLSIGGAGACSSSEQAAVNAVTAAGTVVVVAAGNDGESASAHSPASCSGVITVAGTDRAGGRSSYTNTGSKIAVSAPGGEFADALLSTWNDGTTTPGNDDYVLSYGTSAATAEVSGVAALMLAAQPLLTPAEVRSLLRSSTRAFPDGSCTTSLCGAGIVDAAAAVAAAQAFDVSSSGDGSGGGGGSFDPAFLLATLGGAFLRWNKKA